MKYLHWLAVCAAFFGFFIAIMAIWGIGNNIPRGEYMPLLVAGLATFAVGAAIACKTDKR